MACIAAFALLFGTFAGSAYALDIDGTVTSSQIGESEYNITAPSGHGVSAINTDITIGTEEDNATQTISITALNGYGIYSRGSSSARVTLYAEKSNYIMGNGSNRYGIYSDAWSGSSAVSLYAGDNNVVSGTYSGICSEALSGATSTVNLYAGTSNQVSGNSYGIYSDAFTYGTSTITLVAASNTITANETTGIAVHSYGSGSTVEVSGATTLTAATGADARSGGKIYFRSGDVTANTDTVATADGSGSEIYFYSGLSNEGYDSVIKALNGGTVTVNMTGTGTVNYTGTTSNVDENNPSGTYGTIDMYLTSGSAWYLTGTSTATMLNNNGLLDMTADGGAFSTLTLDTLSGTGSIWMDIDETTNDSDLIYVTDSFDGYQSVKLIPTGDTSLTNATVGTVLMYANNSTGRLVADNVEGTLFWQEYRLDSQTSQDSNYDTEWYISEIGIVTEKDEDTGTETPVETTTVNTVMSAASLNYHSWMMQNTKLLQRLGDLRQGANNGDNGAWFRISGSKLELGGQHGFENKYMQYEVGYDKIVEQTSKYTMYGGIALSFTDGESAYNRGDGDNESKAVSLYFTQINKGGSYLDVVFKLGRWENDFTAYDTSYNRIDGKTENTGMSVSAELGKKFAIGNRGLYIEPQAQLTYGYFDGDSYTVTRGNEQVNVHADGLHSLVGRAGFNLGWDINQRSNVYLKANVLHEFLGDYAIVMNDGINTPLSRTGDYSDTWFLYGLGASFKLGKETPQKRSANFLYFDIERSAGGDIEQEWFYNVGFRFVM